MVHEYSSHRCARAPSRIVLTATLTCAGRRPCDSDPARTIRRGPASTALVRDRDALQAARPLGPGHGSPRVAQRQSDFEHDAAAPRSKVLRIWPTPSAGAASTAASCMPTTCACSRAVFVRAPSPGRCVQARSSRPGRRHERTCGGETAVRTRRTWQPGRGDRRVALPSAPCWLTDCHLSCLSRIQHGRTVTWRGCAPESNGWIDGIHSPRDTSSRREHGREPQSSSIPLAQRRRVRASARSRRLAGTTRSVVSRQRPV